MQNWSDRWRVIRGFVLELHAWLALLGAIAVVFAAAVAVMSWVTNSISVLAAYGWGVPVLVAIGIVLVVVMGLSFAALPVAKAWRAYHPLPVPVAAASGTQLPEIDAREDFKSAVDRLERKLEVLERAYATDLEQFNSRLSADIARLNQLGVSQHEINDVFRNQIQKIQFSLKTLTDRVSTHEQVVASGTHLLIRALRARDAMREILIPNDKIAMSLGKPLAVAKATDYPDSTSWLTDYERWKMAVRTIDQLMIEWTQGATGVAPGPATISLFDLKGHHFERSPMPPENIRTDDTIIPFKTVCWVQSSYANQRDGIFSFFNEKIAYPG